MAAGLLDLLDEVTSGTLIMPRGHPLNPTPGASAETALVRLAGAQPVLLGHSSLPDCIALLLLCSDLSILPWRFRGVSDMSVCAQPALSALL